MIGLNARFLRGVAVACLPALILGGALVLGSCRQRQIPLIEQKCGTCHSARIVYQTRRSEEGWRQVMHGMKLRGLVISAEEEALVLDILFREFLDR